MVWEVIERQETPLEGLDSVYLLVAQDGKYPYYQVEMRHAPGSPVMVFQRPGAFDSWVPMNVVPPGVVPFMLELLGLVGSDQGSLSGPFKPGSVKASGG